MKNLKKNINDNCENENIQLLKSELNKANNLIDYFLVIGINPNICLNDFLYEKDINELNKEDYENYFQPTMRFHELRTSSILDGSNEAYHVNSFNLSGSSNGAKSMEFEEEE